MLWGLVSRPEENGWGRSWSSRKAGKGCARGEAVGHWGHAAPRLPVCGCSVGNNMAIPRQSVPFAEVVTGLTKIPGAPLTPDGCPPLCPPGIHTMRVGLTKRPGRGN